MDIYQPAEDSYLLAKYVEKLVKAKDKVLDLGCGSGIQSETALKKTNKVIGVDINPNAIKHCLSSQYTKKAEFYKSDLFSYFQSKKVFPKNAKFDVIIFNPPYLPDEQDPDEIKAYTTGGKKGYEIIERFLAEAGNFLKDNGIILLVFSSCTKITKVNEAINNYLFNYEILEEKGIFFEKLYCYKITKSPLLLYLAKKKVSNISYLARGKRGIVYKGIYKNKKCAIKVKNEKSAVESTIDMEAKWLKAVNKLKIGPKLYYSDDKIVVMEFIEGEIIQEYLRKNPKTAKKIILASLNQLYLLDKHKIEKKEMSRPFKHIIVRNNNPVMIDFERMHYTESPKNVTQFIQFLMSPKLGLDYNKQKLIELAMSYKKTGNIKDIASYLS